MNIVLSIVLILIFVLCIFTLPLLLYSICDTREHFTPNFVQIFPKSGTIPHTVTFAPTYVDNFSKITVDFGDGKWYFGQNSNIFAHEYNTIGTFNGKISFEDTNIPPQLFTIITSQ